jgi:NAD(P)H dehydrogenase (quinone)
VTFENETVEQAYASRAGYGAPAWEVDGWVTTCTAIAAGEWDIVTDDVSGHDPVSAQQFFESLD